jgi:hypothetical protein
VAERCQPAWRADAARAGACTARACGAGKTPRRRPQDRRGAPPRRRRPRSDRGRRLPPRRPCVGDLRPGSQCHMWPVNASRQDVHSCVAFLAGCCRPSPPGPGRRSSLARRTCRRSCASTAPRPASARPARALRQILCPRGTSPARSSRSRSATSRTEGRSTGGELVRAVTARPARAGPAPAHGRPYAASSSACVSRAASTGVRCPQSPSASCDSRTCALPAPRLPSSSFRRGRSRTVPCASRRRRRPRRRAARHGTFAEVTASRSRFLEVVD